MYGEVQHSLVVYNYSTICSLGYANPSCETVIPKEDVLVTPDIKNLNIKSEYLRGLIDEIG
ncbi:hypothetical protein JYT79_00170 [Cardiobacterium sp. AH-315-I02]|nr:hypothetical protein [Cardiobacterium sp. AH-315-I02]